MKKNEFENETLKGKQSEWKQLNEMKRSKHTKNYFIKLALNSPVPLIFCFLIETLQQASEGKMTFQNPVVVLPKF